MEVVAYIIEQLFPSEDAKLSWYETGDEYKTMNECLKRIEELEKQQKTGYRAVEKRIRLTVMKTI